MRPCVLCGCALSSLTRPCHCSPLPLMSVPFASPMCFSRCLGHAASSRLPFPSTCVLCFWYLCRCHPPVTIIACKCSPFPPSLLLSPFATCVFRLRSLPPLAAPVPSSPLTPVARCAPSCPVRAVLATGGARGWGAVHECVGACVTERESGWCVCVLKRGFASVAPVCVVRLRALLSHSPLFTAHHSLSLLSPLRPPRPPPPRVSRAAWATLLPRAFSSLRRVCCASGISAVATPLSSL